MELKGKTALVTGGLNGIGKAVAEKLASQGANIAVNGRNISNSYENIEILQSYGITARAYHCDVSNIKQISKMVKGIVDEFGSIDILVNNAGIYPSSSFLSTTEEQFDRIMDVNLKGSFFMTQEVAKQAMVPQESGKIISISSMDGWMPASDVSVYGASKAGLNNLVKSFALELAEYNITSNAVAPGWVASDTVLKAGRWKEVVEKIPNGRLSTYEEISEVVLFLASNKSIYINGEIINVNGGLLMN